jgi:N-acetyl-anhydromuramyl-L-alanine amidase AmpD
VLSTGPQANNDITNANSIGIEVSAADDSDVLPVQVTAATALISSLMSRYKIPAEMVAGHGQIWGQSRPRDEGMTIVNAVGGQYRQPVASNQNAMPKK